ncbi:hypothetical protein [Halobacillus litoralis]|uniref:hypothetical protein n=1 Tax=Halobacillus litoralis TaxID=45668 RepID=UPI001CFE0ABD|nr:hypothetical protein [Halobacillus litoralis]
MNLSIEGIEKKLKQLEKDLLEARLLLDQTKESMLKEGSFHVFSYFNYSLRLPKKTDDPTLYILGSFIIKNKGDRTLHRPYICLKFNQNQDISFSGKISQEDLVDPGFSPVPMQTWYYLDEESQLLAHKEGEYWLEPIDVSELPADRSLSFANFMIRLERTKLDGPFKLEGALFGDEIPEGLKALNKIQINLAK